MSLNNLGSEALDQGAPERAATFCEEGLSIARKLGDKGQTATLLGILGVAMLHRGNLKRATELLQESLTMLHELGDKAKLHASLVYLAHVAGTMGEPLREARLFGAAQDLRESVGMALMDLDARQDLSSPGLPPALRWRKRRGNGRGRRDGP